MEKNKENFRETKLSRMELTQRNLPNLDLI